MKSLSITTQGILPFIFAMMGLSAGEGQAEASRIKPPKVPSSERREQNPFAIVIRTPTVGSLGGKHATMEAGVGFNYHLSGKHSLYANAQIGYAGNLGTFSGDGNSWRAVAGYQRYFGNFFYIAGGAGVRGMNVGTNQYRSYDRCTNGESYCNIETSRYQTVAAGADGSTGLLWQKEKVVIGLEIVNVFVPSAMLKSRSRSTDDTLSEEQAKRNAKDAAMGGDASLPRFLIGFSF